MSVYFCLIVLMYIQRIMLMEINITGNKSKHDVITQEIRKTAPYTLLPFMPKLTRNCGRKNTTALRQQKCAWQPVRKGSFCGILGYGMVYTINRLPAFRKTFCHNLQGSMSHDDEVMNIM